MLHDLALTFQNYQHSTTQENKFFKTRALFDIFCNVCNETFAIALTAQLFHENGLQIKMSNDITIDFFMSQGGVATIFSRNKNPEFSGRKYIV